MSGTLYIVSTPIGNLEDISFRAVRVLGEVQLVACEDTRQTRKLLDHYGIKTPAISYHEHNEAARATVLVERLLAGEDIALVSDAGTPLVSDPGYRVVTAAVDAGIRIVPIPGASALLAALAGSGLPTDAFRFGGFLPAKSLPRRKLLEQMRSERATLVFYEAPHRITEALEDIQATLGDRQVVVARELTKMHEEWIRGTPLEVAEALRSRPAVKGEITVLIDRAHVPLPDDRPLPEAVEAAMREGLSRMDAIKQVARRRGLSKREVYDCVGKNDSRSG
jgi:16S rRNA (cytidine1402-2'-O)-methyltransferase